MENFEDYIYHSISSKFEQIELKKSLLNSDTIEKKEHDKLCFDILNLYVEIFLYKFCLNESQRKLLFEDFEEVKMNIDSFLTISPCDNVLQSYLSFLKMDTARAIRTKNIHDIYYFESKYDVINAEDGHVEENEGLYITINNVYLIEDLVNYLSEKHFPVISPKEKITWKISAAAFAYLFLEMANLGYFNTPSSGGKDSRSKIARILSQVCDVSGCKESTLVQQFKSNDFESGKISGKLKLPDVELLK